MRIEYVIPCKYAEVNDALATIIGAGIDTTQVPGFPSRVQLMLAIRVLGTDEEMPGEHRIQCSVRDSNGNPVGEELDAELTLPGANIPGGHPAGEGWLQNLMLALGVAFEAPAAGAYTIHVMFDDAEYPVPVYIVGP